MLAYASQYSASFQPQSESHIVREHRHKDMRAAIRDPSKLATTSVDPLPHKQSSSFRRERPHPAHHLQPTERIEQAASADPRQPGISSTLDRQASGGNPRTSTVGSPSRPRSSHQTLQQEPPVSPRHLDIANYPTADLLKLLASLLQQIASANDTLRTSVPSPPSSPIVSSTNSFSSPSSLAGPWNSLTSASRTTIVSPGSPFSFHARNIPTISIESYLLRILKYCPTTNEVFLSLLVYFDRMSRMCGNPTGTTAGTDSMPSGFAIDSYNVHRLVIAGVTVASKFFSDVFYTNSRYAKVGGLPQSELNQLELQFLLLNDFQLVISLEEMQRYADQLLLYSTSTHTPSSTPPTNPTFPGPAPASPARALPTPDPSPRPPPTDVHPVSDENHHVLRHQPSYDESQSEGGYGTTDDEPTIKPDHSGASSEDARSINTVSSTASSTTTTPAVSPRHRPRATPRASRDPDDGGAISASEGDEADVDGEGDETDDEEDYRSTARRALSGDIRMGSP